MQLRAFTEKLRGMQGFSCHFSPWRWGRLIPAIFILLAACKDDPEPFASTEPYANFTMAIGATAAGTAGSRDNDFDRPMGLALDSEEDLLYVADSGNHRIQVWDISGLPEDIPVYSATIGGGVPGGSGDEEFLRPAALALDSEGDLLYVADTGNHRIQVWDISTDPPVYSATIGGGAAGATAGATNDDFDSPAALVLDSASGRLYVADTGNHRIQVWDISTDPPAYSATLGRPEDDEELEEDEFNTPIGLALDTADEILHVADSGNHRIQGWLVPEDISEAAYNDGSTIGQDGSGAGAGFGPGRLDTPAGLAFDGAGNLLYVADQYNHRIQLFFTEGGLALPIGFIGSFGASADQLNGPTAVALDREGGILYVSDSANHRLQIAQLPAD